MTVLPIPSPFKLPVADEIDDMDIRFELAEETTLAPESAGVGNVYRKASL